PLTVRCLKSGVTSSARWRMSTSRSGAYLRCSEESSGARNVADFRHSTAFASVSARTMEVAAQTKPVKMRQGRVRFMVDCNAGVSQNQPKAEAENATCRRDHDAEFTPCSPDQRPP